MQLCVMMDVHLPHVPVEVLKHLPADGVVVRVQADLDHVVHGVLAPVAVLPGLVEVPQAIVGLPGVPAGHSGV